MPARLPKFENEAQEAKWWFEHREEVGSELVAAFKEGRLGPGAKARYLEKLRQQASASTVQEQSSGTTSSEVTS